MDTAIDFIRPEFLNILFFQQKNLVIFPYVDLKHLHGLDLFTIGHNTIDLESTALHNVREFLEVEVNNSYSQIPDLYFIYNVDKENLHKLTELNDVRCIINTNENVRDLVNGHTYIFFNKKHNQFLNYDIPDSELEFEKYLISNSENEMILQDKIQHIKSIATKIFTEVNKDSELKHLPEILQAYEKKYWHAIIKFTENYYNINIPDVSTLTSTGSRKEKLQDFSQEYELIVSTSKQIGKEFIQLLHEYRGKRVNPSNLELEELFNPQKLYNYLRNHHWKEGIPHEFIDGWYKMEFSQYTLNEMDQVDFENILKKLGVSYSFSARSNSESIPVKAPLIKSISEPMPSPHDAWDEFRKWILNHVNTLEFLTEDLSKSSTNSIDSKSKSILFEEILELEKLIGVKGEQNTVKASEDDMSPNSLIVDITNILNLDKDKEGNVKAENIVKIRDAAICLGYMPELVADASMKHKIDNPELYEQLCNQGYVGQSPAGTEADWWVLTLAKSEKCKFLANDLYRDYRKEFGEEWIFKNRLTCYFFNGKFFIRENENNKN